MFTTLITFFTITILFMLFVLIMLIYVFKETLKRNNNTMDMKEIAEYFDISENTIHKIFQKLKWIERKPKYWKVTERGKMKKGIEVQNFKKDIKEPLWDIEIVNDKTLINTIEIYQKLNNN